MSAVSDVPRDLRQIKYARSKTKQPRKNDELAELIDKANGDSFVCNVQVSPNLRVVIASEEQIQDLKTFCCCPHDFSILSIDTTYNVSKSSYLTPTTYQHMNLLDRKTGCHPHMPGPAIIHNKLDAKTFQYFGNTLLECDRGLIDVMAIGSDRDPAMDKGFCQTFPIASLLACKKHVEDNIRVKLKALGITGEAKSSFLKDIFGDDQNKEQGLVDCLSNEQFNSKLLALQNIWNKRECKARKMTDPKFFDYFNRNVADAVKRKNATNCQAKCRVKR